MSHGDRQRRKILDAGVKLWATTGAAPAAQHLANAVGIKSHSAVLYHFGNAEAMKNAIASHAVECKNSRVIVQLIALSHDAVSRMTDAEKADHFASVADTQA